MKKILASAVAMMLLAGIFLVAIPTVGASILEVGPGKTYLTIQAALDAGGPGDIIMVYPGTYGPFNVSGKVDMTIVANVTHTVVVNGSQSVTTNYGNRDVVISVSDSLNITINGLDIEGHSLGTTNPKNYGVIYESSSGAIVDCIVSPNTIGDMAGVAITAWDGSDLTVDSCTIKNYGRIGVFYYNNCTGEVYDNTIIGQVYSGEGEVCYGIEVHGVAGDPDPNTASQITVRGNEIYNHDNTYVPEPSWSSAGIVINGWLGLYDEADSTVIIEENDIHDNYYGIEVVTSSLSYAHHNNIYDSRIYGVVQDSDYASNNVTFDARFNWWGHASGPNQTVTNPTGLGDEITDYVGYSAWLGGVFQTTPRTYHVNLNGTIQEAIDDANAGDTILVHEGTYNETLYINKTLTVKAASTPIIKGGGSVTTNYGARDAVIFVEDATNVVIEGLDIEGEGLGTTNPKNYAVIYEESSGTIRNCIISPNTVGDLQSTGIASWDGSDLTVQSCTIENFGRIGVFYFSGCSGGIYNNTIMGQTYSGEGDVNYGIEVEAYDFACNVEIIGNNIYNCDNTFSPEPTWSSAGVIVDGWRALYDLSPSTVVIRENAIHSNYYGIEVVANPYSYAQYNNISNNREYGVIHDSDYASNNVTFDARFNWWGHSSGPSGVGPGTGDAVSEYVNFDPWLSCYKPAVGATICIDPPTVEKYTFVGIESSNFTVDVRVKSVTNLWGFDFELTWNSSLLSFTLANYTSQLNALWGTGRWEVIKNEFSAGWFKFAALALSPAVGFSGSAPLVKLTFRIEYGPCYIEPDYKLQTRLHFALVKLSNSSAEPICAQVQDGTYIIHAVRPWLKMYYTRTGSDSITCKRLGEVFTVQVKLVDAFKVSGFEIEIRYNTTLVTPVSITWGNLTGFLPGPYLIKDYTVDEVNGLIRFRLTENLTAGAPLAYGDRVLAEITFNVTRAKMWKKCTQWENYFHDQIGYSFWNISVRCPASYFLTGNLVHISNAEYWYVPIQGDINSDGDVGILDLRTVAYYYEVELGDPDWTVASKYDLNCDDIIDIYDLVLIATNFGYHYGY